MRDRHLKMQGGGVGLCARGAYLRDTMVQCMYAYSNCGWCMYFPLDYTALMV